MSFEVVDSAEGLARTVEVLRGAPAIALDTEGNSFHAYRDRVCMMQLAVGPEPRIFLVDPLSVDPAPLAPLFADPARRLVVHGGDYDVRSLRRDFKFEFGRMFDTMIAAQTLGLPELGLLALLKNELGVVIRKNEQRSDWGKRPLRDEQLRYAAEDVRNLLPLAEKIEAKLVETQRLAAAEAQFEKLRHLVAREKPFDVNGYRRIKGTRELDPAQTRLLRTLWLARDRLSRELDRAPFKVIGEDIMAKVAKQRPKSLDELRAIRGVNELVVRRLGAEIVATASAPDSGATA